MIHFDLHFTHLPRNNLLLFFFVHTKKEIIRFQLTIHVWFSLYVSFKSFNGKNFLYYKREILEIVTITIKEILKYYYGGYWKYYRRYYRRGNPTIYNTGNITYFKGNMKYGITGITYVWPRTLNHVFLITPRQNLLLLLW